jgi:PKD repeat protein
MPADALKFSSNSAFEALSYADVFKTVSGQITTNGTLTIWTPATDKKFRVKAIYVDAVVDVILAASGTAGVYLQVFDDTTAKFDVAAFTATAAAGTSKSRMIDLRQGYVSAAANNALKIGFSASITTGKVDLSVIAIGTEQ